MNELLCVRFFDATDNLIEEFTEHVDDAIKRIANFVELHGTDPDENGAGAQAGRITFTPIRETEPSA